MLATASFDATTAIWENVGGDFECVSTLELEGPKYEIKSVSWNSAGNLLATCGRDMSVHIWEVIAGNGFDIWGEVLQGHTQDVKMVKWHPTEDILFSCSYDKLITLSRFGYMETVMMIGNALGESNNGHTSTVWALSFNAKGDKMVTCSDDLTLKVWETEEDIRKLKQSSGEFSFSPWRHICTLSGYHERTIFSVHWSRGGIFASGAADDTIQLSVENNESEVDGGPLYKSLLKKEKAHDMDINCVQWSPGEKPLLASASDDGTIKVWNLVSQ